MHSGGYTILIRSLLILGIPAINGHEPLDYDFINTFDASDTNGVNYRLPNNTKPEHYAISLETNVHENNFTFLGQVTITLRALEATKNITIHHRQLTIGRVILQEADNIIPIKVDISYDKTTEFLVITVPDGLKKDQRYKLLIIYDGTLRTDMGGFYRSSYVNSKNETRLVNKSSILGRLFFQNVYNLNVCLKLCRWIATTQFEQTEARHAFPCYDEPALKATFDIDIKHGQSYNAVSNMKVRKMES